MPWVTAIGGLAAGVIGDVMSSQGQQSTNAMQMAMMQQSEQWQQMMSNTAMQRRVTDLRAAGLNPLLAIGGPGASMGSPVMPNLQNPAGSFGQLGQQATNALQLGTQQAQIDLMKSQTAKTSAEAQNVPIQGQLLYQQIATLQADKAYTEAKTQFTQGPETELTLAQSGVQQSLVKLNDAQRQVFYTTVDKLNADATAAYAAAGSYDAQAALSRATSRLTDIESNIKAPLQQYAAFQARQAAIQAGQATTTGTAQAAQASQEIQFRNSWWGKILSALGVTSSGGAVTQAVSTGAQVATAAKF